MKGKRLIWVIAIVLCLSVAFSLWATQQQNPTDSAKSLEEAPNFTLPDLNGNPFRLSDLRGKVVILDFWATWCPSCQREIPHFESLYQQYQKQGLEIIGIALDKKGVEVVKPFAENKGITYPILISDQKVTKDYGGIWGIPTTFVIDRQGRIVEKIVGYRDKEVFESIIQGLL